MQVRARIPMFILLFLTKNNYGYIVATKPPPRHRPSTFVAFADRHVTFVQFTRHRRTFDDHNDVAGCVFQFRSDRVRESGDSGCGRNLMQSVTMTVEFHI